MSKNITTISIVLALILVVATGLPQVLRASEVTGTINAGTASVGQPATFVVDGPFIFKSAIIGILILEVLTLIIISLAKRRKILEG